MRKAILPNPWVPFVERTLSIPDGTPLRNSCHGSLSKCSPSSNGTKPKVYFQKEHFEPEVFCGNRPRGVTVSTLDSESSDRGSNPREVSRQILKNELKRECNIALDSTIASLQCVFCATTYPLLSMPWVPFVVRTLSVPMTHHSEDLSLSKHHVR